MKKIIAFINKKGGCGKTTTLMALADGLAIRGERVLVVDLDSQMNLSKGYGDFHFSKYSIYDVLCEKGFDIYDAIQHVGEEYFGNQEIPGKVDILPANAFVDRLQQSLDLMMRKEYRVLMAFQKLNPNDYDYILIDTSPSPVTDIVITNAMAASDEIIITTLLEPFSTTGVELVLPRVENVIEEQLNPELKVNGILCTQVAGRLTKNESVELLDLKAYAEKKGIYAYESYITRQNTVPTKQRERKSLFYRNAYYYDRWGNKRNSNSKKMLSVVEQYTNFINEFIKRIGE